MNFLLTWVAESWKNGNKMAVVQKTIFISGCEPNDIQTRINESYEKEHQGLISACMGKSRGGTDRVVIYHLSIVTI
ncbi:MAG: hypothetical protein WCT16_01585 [Candidatus Buchananbacteria bacterium]